MRGSVAQPVLSEPDALARPFANAERQRSRLAGRNAPSAGSTASRQPLARLGCDSCTAHPGPISLARLSPGPHTSLRGGSMSLRRSLAAACGAVAFLSVVSAAHAGPWGLPRGEFYTELTGSFFSSNTYLNRDGTRVSFDAAFEERALTSHTEIGWKKNT